MAQNSTGTPSATYGAQKGSPLLKYSAGAGAGIIPGDSGQLTETHTSYHNDDSAFPTHTHKQKG